MSQFCYALAFNLLHYILIAFQKKEIQENLNLPGWPYEKMLHCHIYAC